MIPTRPFTDDQIEDIREEFQRRMHQDASPDDRVMARRILRTIDYGAAFTMEQLQTIAKHYRENHVDHPGTPLMDPETWQIILACENYREEWAFHDEV